MISDIGVLPVIPNGNTLLASRMATRGRKTPVESKRGLILRFVKEVGASYTSGRVVFCWSHDNLQAIAKEFGLQDARDWPGSDDNFILSNVSAKPVLDRVVASFTMRPITN